MCGEHHTAKAFLHSHFTSMENLTQNTSHDKLIYAPHLDELMTEHIINSILFLITIYWTKDLYLHLHCSFMQVV